MAEHRWGRDRFLASAVVLQEVLLPRLSAVDLLRLSLSCKEIQAWLLNIPPRLWQVHLPQLLFCSKLSLIFDPSACSSPYHHLACRMLPETQIQATWRAWAPHRKSSLP